jgi:hypothetical protein
VSDGWTSREFGTIFTIASLKWRPVIAPIPDEIDRDPGALNLGEGSWFAPSVDTSTWRHGWTLTRNDRSLTLPRLCGFQQFPLSKPSCLGAGQELQVDTLAS